MVVAVAAVGVIYQALVVTEARFGKLIHGVYGMADLLRRAMPPDMAQTPGVLPAVLETVDTALLGTLAAVVIAVPLACCAADNITPHRIVYYGARTLIGLFRAVPDLVWALLFVTAVGLGPFAGVLALAVHSIGMLGRLIAEAIEDGEALPVQALSVTGANRLQVITHAVLPGVLPTAVGIALYRLDENVRASLVLGFVGAGGIGFELLTSMSLFNYQKVAMLLIVTFVLVLGVERGSAALRRRVA
nr:phosphonate ABC transporter, permease protein PhnE [Actinopolymorpha pittospori]